MGTRVGRRFGVDALRRQDSQSAAEASLAVGRKLARLVAEADVGVRLEIRTRGAAGQLRVNVVVSAPSVLVPRQRGLSTADAVVAHVAHEVAALLDEVARTSPVEPSGDDVEPLPAAVLDAVPQVSESIIRIAGFLEDLDDDAPDTRFWSMLRTVDPEETAGILLANPDLTLVQTLECAAQEIVEQARQDSVDRILIPKANPELAEAVGSPVLARLCVESRAPGGLVPLRVREHLRRWFSSVDLVDQGGEEQLRAPSDADLALVSLVVPEVVAAGMLRLPVTLVDAFPGLAVEPVHVPLRAPLGDGLGIRFGRATDLQGDEVDVVVPIETMTRHVHVLGETGTGKSSLLTAICVETARLGQGLLLLDPHGTTVDRVLRDLPPEAHQRTWVVRCGAAANPVRLNPFAVESEALRDLVIADMLEAFQSLFDPAHQGIVGPRFQHMMRMALAALAEAVGPRASLLDVPRMYNDQEFRNAVVRLVASPDVRQYWTAEVPSSQRSSDFGEVVSWVNSKFTSFASSAAVRGMLETGADSIDPVDAMAGNRIVLVDLDRGTLGAIGARVVGLLYLLRYWLAALNRPEPTPCTIVVDEAHSFSATSLASILAEGRKFGLAAVLAHQYVAQLDPRLAEALTGSTGSRIAFRTGRDDAAYLQVSMSPEFGVLDLAGLPRLQAAARIADTGTLIRPFTLTVDHAGDPRRTGFSRAVHLIESRSRHDLVDPQRDARRLAAADLSPETTAAVPGESQSLKEWLESRRSNAARPAPKDDE